MLLVALLVNCISIACITLGSSRSPAPDFKTILSHTFIYQFTLSFNSCYKCLMPHSFIQYLLSTYLVPDTFLHTGDITVRKTDILPAFTHLAMQLTLCSEIWKIQRRIKQSFLTSRNHNFYRRINPTTIQAQQELNTYTRAVSQFQARI